MPIGYKKIHPDGVDTVRPYCKSRHLTFVWHNLNG